MLIPFAEWRPDVANINRNATDDLLNVLPADGSYIPFPLLQAVRPAMAARPLGGITARSSSGQLFIFLATTDKIYMAATTTGGSWVDVSGTSYSATTEAPWCFTQFGDYVIAVNPNDNPQKFRLGSDTAFSDIGGSPPRARLAKVWGSFLALMHLTNDPNKVHWSDIENIDNWTIGTGSLSDTQVFPDGGVIQGSSETTNPIIFLERAIYIGTFVPGSREVFTFTKVHDRRGAKSQSSIATRGSYIFYADEGGFYQIGLDGQIVAIGLEKVDRTYFNLLTQANQELIQGAIDPFHSRVYWAITIGSGSFYDRILVYDWNLQKWTVGEASISLLVPSGSPGYTLEDLDAIADLDTLADSLDSQVWQASAPVMAAVNDTHRLSFFTGGAAQATLTTQELGATDGELQRVTELYPVIDCDTLGEIDCYILSRFRRSQTYTTSAVFNPSSNTGIARKNNRARFQRFRIKVDEGATWNHAIGINVNPVPAGKR